MSVTLKDRYRGCLLGLACGDAFGTTLEFQEPGSFKLHTEMIGQGPFDLLPGQWTDDTSMALCIIESLLKKGEFDLKDQLESFVKWSEEGHLSSNGECFDIGMTTSAALSYFKQSQNTHTIYNAPHMAGNGSLMRLAGVPLFFGVNKPEQAIAQSGESSHTTHGAPAAVDACRYYAALIIGALGGQTKDKILAEHYLPDGVPKGYWTNHPLCKEINEIANGNYKNMNPPQITGSGYVVKTMEAALWAFANTSSFEDGLIKAVNLGDDADTVGAIYGMLAGAFYGVNAIPEKWRNLCSFHSLIILMADELLRVSQGSSQNQPEQEGSSYARVKKAFDAIEQQFRHIRYQNSATDLDEVWRKIEENAAKALEENEKKYAKEFCAEFRRTMSRRFASRQ